MVFCWRSKDIINYETLLHLFLWMGTLLFKERCRRRYTVSNNWSQVRDSFNVGNIIVYWLGYWTRIQSSGPLTWVIWYLEKFMHKSRIISEKPWQGNGKGKYLIVIKKSTGLLMSFRGLILPSLPRLAYIWGKSHQLPHFKD